MKHYSSLTGVSLNKCILTIGSFDGVHLGHRELLTTVVKSSNSENADSAVITFNPIPFVYFRKIFEPYNLLDKSNKSKLLESLGIDHLITLTFDKQLSSLKPEAFIEFVLQHICINKLIIGYDFTLGKDKTGSFSVLNNIGTAKGFEVIVIPPLKVNGNIVSSSLIRKTLKSGNVKQAGKYLGRGYSIGGIVVSGDGRGKQVGFPTANIDYNKTRLLPKNGVYVTLAKINGRSYPSVTNIGLRPTFANQLNIPRIETYILDFNENIYDKYITIEFIDFIREELKFSSIKELKLQIDKDVLFTNKALSDVIKTKNIPSRS